MNFRVLLPICIKTIQEFLEDKALRLAAALSFYTTLSLAPLLLIVTAVAALVFGNDAARNAIVSQLTALIGPIGGEAIKKMLESSSKLGEGIFSLIAGVVTLLLGATGVVIHLKDAMNTIWEVRERSNEGIKKLILQRVLTFAMILCIGFLLLVSLVISALLSAMDSLWTAQTTLLVKTVNFVVSLGTITFLFAMIFKLLPDIKLRWRNVWVGAFVTALLFTVGKTLTGLYLARSSVASAYGAAGSFVIILLWVYYSAAILFLGAEFTQVFTLYTERRNTKGGSIDMTLDHENEEFVFPIEEERPAESTLPKMEPPSNNSDSRLLSVARFSGYESARLEKSIKSIEKKWKISKWIYRVVDFLGVKRSAKLAWKGYKAKHAWEELTEDEPRKSIEPPPELSSKKIDPLNNG